MSTVTHGNGRASVLERPEMEQKAAEHLWVHGWDMDWEELIEREGLKVFARAKDSTLYDVRGREFIDGLAGLMVVNVGHGRREIGEAMAKQAGEIAYAASSNYTTIPTVQLAETLARITPGDLSRVFVDANHVDTELGKTCPGHQADIAGADHRNAHDSTCWSESRRR